MAYKIKLQMLLPYLEEKINNLPNNLEFLKGFAKFALKCGKNYVASNHLYIPKHNKSSIDSERNKILKVVASCPKKSTWTDICNIGSALWKGACNVVDATKKALSNIGSAIWDGICTAGKYVMKGINSILSKLDDILDEFTRVGAAFVLVGGILAAAMTLPGAIIGATGIMVAGTTTSAIAMLGIGLGKFALYAGALVIAGGALQMASGATGYRLDGSRLTKKQAESRIRNGKTNIDIAL